MGKRKKFKYREIAYITARQRGLWNGHPHILCPECGLPLVDYETIELDHRRDLALLGEDDLDNLAFLHGHCHKAKSRKQAKVLAKAKRQAGETGQRKRRKKHGSKLKSAGFRKDVRRKMNGSVEKR